MGKLYDKEFWADTLNQLAALAPPPGEPINEDNVRRILEISCNALSQLVDDPEFQADIENTVAESATIPDASSTATFEAFLDSFILLENKVLADAGVNSAALSNLEREIRRIASSPDLDSRDGMPGMIAFLRRLACEPSATDDPGRPLWRAVWRGVKGIGLVGIDAGTAAAGTVLLGPAGAAAVGTVAGFSVAYGYRLVTEALRGRF